MRKLTVFLFIYLSTASGQITGFWGVRYMPEPDSPNSLVSNSHGDIFGVGYSVWRSTNQGNTWTKLIVPNENAGLQVIIDKNDKLYTVGGPGVWFSTDNGDTWHDPSNFVRGSYRIAMSSNGTIFVSADQSDGIYRSYDSARTWKNVFSNASVGAIHVAPRTETVLAFAGTGLGTRFIRSTNNGDTWTALKLEDTTWTANAFASDSSGNVFAIAKSPGFRQYSRIRKSTDDGLTWTVLPFKSQYDFEDILINSVGQAFIATGGDAVYRSSDDWNTVTWLPTPEDNTTQCLGIQRDGRLLCGGVYRVYISLESTTVGVESVPMPAEPDLSPVYPNPAINEGIVTLSIDRAASVSLTVVNTLGRTVHAALNEELPAGRRSVSLDLRGLPAGVYFCRLQTPHGVKLSPFAVVQ